VAQQGLLAAADGGLVLAAMAERMAQHRVAPGCGAGHRRRGALERDGISALTPTRLAVVALDEALDDDDAVSPALADRLGSGWICGAVGARPAKAEADMAPTCWPRARVRRGAGARQDHGSPVCGDLGAGCGLGAGGLAGAARGACFGRVVRSAEADADDAAWPRAWCWHRAPRKGRLRSQSRPRTRPSRRPKPEPLRRPRTRPAEDPLHGELQNQIVEAALAAIPPACWRGWPVASSA
jgi:magnesium chelatase subunit D